MLSIRRLLFKNYRKHFSSQTSNGLKDVDKQQPINETYCQVLDSHVQSKMESKYLAIETKRSIKEEYYYKTNFFRIMSHIHNGPRTIDMTISRRYWEMIYERHDIIFSEIPDHKTIRNIVRRLSAVPLKYKFAYSYFMIGSIVAIISSVMMFIYLINFEMRRKTHNTTQTLTFIEELLPCIFGYTAVSCIVGIGCGIFWPALFPCVINDVRKIYIQ